MQFKKNPNLKIKQLHSQVNFKLQTNDIGLNFILKNVFHMVWPKFH